MIFDAMTFATAVFDFIFSVQFCAVLLTSVDPEVANEATRMHRHGNPASLLTRDSAAAVVGRVRYEL